jgi:predicted nucleic acid-binding protein
LTPALLLAASGLRERYSLSFWDSMIVASSLLAGVGVLYKELVAAADRNGASLNTFVNVALAQTVGVQTLSRQV